MALCTHHAYDRSAERSWAVHAAARKSRPISSPMTMPVAATGKGSNERGSANLPAA